MTTPDASTAPRFALFTNGARFSCAVLNRLRACKFIPDLLVLPEYPPATYQADIIQITPSRKILSLGPNIELAYAPRQDQAQCAELIRRKNLDFILLACWPYLLESEMRLSVNQAALNLHPSRLPLYRGADPLQQQIAAGDYCCGVTLHLLDAQFDHGDIVAQAEFEVDAAQLQIEFLELRCAELGVDLFIKAARSGQKRWQLIPQPD